MNKYRFRFAKYDRMRFIGHLDLLKLIQKLINRCNFPINHSEGFNPHQKTIFALPLSLGVSSVGEYLDIELLEDIDVNILMDKLNETLPKGIEILSARKIIVGEKSCAAAIESAEYEVELPKVNNLDNVIKNILDQKEILIMKKTKKSEKETDIRVDIQSIENISNNNNNIIKMVLSAGSNRNLKIDIVLQKLCDEMEVEFDKYNTKIKRIDMFKYNNEEEKKLISLSL